MNKAVNWIMDKLDSRPIIPEMDKAIKACQAWAMKDHGYVSKNLRIFEWNPTFLDFYELVSHIFVGVLLKPEGMTYQAMIGYISGNIRCLEPLDRAKCAAEVIAIAYNCDLIEVEKISDKTLMITTDYTWNEPIPEELRHMPSFKQPEPIVNNPILGSRFKQHDFDICKGHINRMNSIPLSLELRVIDAMPEAPAKAFEWQEQVDDWNKFVAESNQAYEEVRLRGNRFYMNHNYDTRGRCYCEGYWINYQGTSFKKAIVQLADKEVVKL